tara:strand:+ start:62 stop:763 length:702 start_codon:yes stop_codon:yes gene_type:complete
MANLDNIVDVFAGASIVSNDLVIPTGQLPRFNQGDAVAEGAEVVYALLAAMHTAVNAAGNENTSLSSSVNNTFNASALTMNRSFTFNTTLDVSAKLNDFDVKLDTRNTHQSLALTTSTDGMSAGVGLVVATLGDYTIASDDPGDYIIELVVKANGVKQTYDAKYTFGITDASYGADTAKWAVVNDGTKFYLSVSNESGLNTGAHSLTVTLDDSSVDFPSESPVSVTITVDEVV